MLIDKYNNGADKTNNHLLIEIFSNEENFPFLEKIYDSKEKTALIARDRYGIKQIYYSIDNNRLIFGSELKAILSYPINKELDKDCLLYTSPSRRDGLLARMPSSA